MYMQLVSRGLSSCSEILLSLFLSNEVRNYFSSPRCGAESLGLIFAAYVWILGPYYRPCLSHFGEKSGSISVFGFSQM